LPGLRDATRREGVGERTRELLRLDVEGGADLFGAKASGALLEQLDDPVDHPADVVGRPAPEASAASATTAAEIERAPRSGCSAATAHASPPSAGPSNRHEIIERRTAKGVDDLAGELCCETIDLGPKGAHRRAANRNS
jgi:hypothetical protein